MNSDYWLRHVRPSVRIEKLDFHWTNLREVTYWLLSISVESLQAWLQPDKVTHLTWRQTYIYERSGY